MVQGVESPSDLIKIQISITFIILVGHRYAHFLQVDGPLS